MSIAADVSTSHMRPKSIVVLSDGTGNSPSKIFKTNVWRLYQALDLSSPIPKEAAQGLGQQIAFYHDGVGSSRFKLFALLGGVFGYGLKRNILVLYIFLCRNYRPGDRIYAFGFSRGAFAVSLLVALVCSQGLLRCTTEEDFARYSKDAYRMFRREFYISLHPPKTRHPGQFPSPDLSGPRGPLQAVS